VSVQIDYLINYDLFYELSHVIVLHNCYMLIVLLLLIIFLPLEKNRFALFAHLLLVSLIVLAAQVRMQRLIYHIDCGLLNFFLSSELLFRMLIYFT